MDAFTASFAARPFNLDTILKNNGLTAEIQQHLSRVYLCLTAMMISSTLAVYLYITQGFLYDSMIPALGAFACLFYLGYTRGDLSHKRLGALLLLGFLKGATVAPLVDMALNVDPAIVVTAFLGTATIFACFSAFALVSKRREYFYLGSILSSCTLGMVVVSFANMWLRSNLIFGAELYIGLFVFLGYVVFDTQLMLESAIMGNRDYIWQAMELFIDLVAIFVRVLIILLRNQQKRQENDRRKRSSNNNRR